MYIYIYIYIYMYVYIYIYIDNVGNAEILAINFTMPKSSAGTSAGTVSSSNCSSKSKY